MEEKAALASLGLRQAVRGHLMAGRCDAATALLGQHAPELVHASGSDARPSLDVFFSVSCLSFIELIRCARARRMPGTAPRPQTPLLTLRSVEQHEQPHWQHCMPGLACHPNWGLSFLG